MVNMSKYAIVTEIVKKYKKKEPVDDNGDDDNEDTH